MKLQEVAEKKVTPETKIKRILRELTIKYGLPLKWEPAQAIVVNSKTKTGSFNIGFYLYAGLDIASLYSGDPEIEKAINDRLKGKDPKSKFVRLMDELPARVKQEFPNLKQVAVADIHEYIKRAKTDSYSTVKPNDWSYFDCDNVKLGKEIMKLKLLDPETEGYGMRMIKLVFDTSNSLTTYNPLQTRKDAARIIGRHAKKLFNWVVAADGERDVMFSDSMNKPGNRWIEFGPSVQEMRKIEWLPNYTENPDPQPDPKWHGQLEEILKSAQPDLQKLAMSSPVKISWRIVSGMGTSGKLEPKTPAIRVEFGEIES
jgi:hypothetical protein